MNARAFTLVELMVVIGIIVLLAGLTLTVGVAVVQGSEIRQTKATIKLLETAVLEWQAAMDRQVTYGVPDEPVGGARYEIEEPSSHSPLLDEQMTEQLIAIMMRNGTVREILAQIDPDMVEHEQFTVGGQTYDTLEIRDAWGSPITAVFPGRLWDSGNDQASPRDEDGTIRTLCERTCGIAENRRICWLSRGPDGRPGSLAAQPDDPLFKDTQDNLYSYEPVSPRP